MSSISAKLYRPLTRLLGKQIRAAETAEQTREVVDRWSRFFLPPGGVKIEPDELGGVAALRVTPAKLTSDAALLILHGGGYIFGSAQGYRAHGARLAKLIGARTYVLDYRLAPEHPYPAALDDAMAAYGALLEEHEPNKIVFIGDSAGGGLSVATMHRARDTDVPLPGCAVLLCPWLDLTLSGQSMDANEPTELLVPRAVLTRMADAYAADTDRAQAGLSPLFGKQDGLPPVLVQASAAEALYSDSERFVPLAKSAGVDVRFETVPDMWHDWQLMAPAVREARQSLATAADFIRGRLGH